MDQTMKKVLIAVLLVLIAVVSMLLVADWAMDPAAHSEIIASIDGKTATVLRLTATSALASAGISAIPGDAATPIAEKLADFSEYFLLILCVLYSEKYLLTIMGAGVFRVLIPAACAMGILGIFWNPKLVRRLALRLAIIALALYLVIPLSLRVSDAIYSTYEASISTTISSAEDLNQETAQLTEAGEDKGLIASALERLSETTQSLAEKAGHILNRFVEALAVMIVTACIIPLLVLLFFLWVIKQFTGLDLSRPLFRRRGDAGTDAAS